MPPSVFLQQTAFAHVNSRFLGHQVVGVFNCAVTFGIFQFFVLVASDPIKLQQPVIKACTSSDLAGTHFIGLPVPRDDRLGAGTAGRSAHS